MELEKHDVIDLLKQVSDHHRRIEILEKDRHVCQQTNRICDIERTQKDLMTAIEKMQNTQEKMHHDIINYKLEASKQTKTIIAGFIGVVVSILITSITLYKDVLNTLDSKFMKVFEITTQLKIDAGK